MPPLIFSHANDQRVRDGDSVLFFNFRADRARQLSQAFLLKDFDGFDREVWPEVHFVTLAQYDVTYSSPFIFQPMELAYILGEVVSVAGKSQLRIAETEKYAHKFRLRDGILADVAPTLLFLLGLPQPKEMTGHNLLVPISQKTGIS